MKLHDLAKQSNKRFKSSGMLCPVFGQVILTHTISRVTQHNIAEDVNSQQRCCENFKSGRVE